MLIAWKQQDDQRRQWKSTTSKAFRLHRISGWTHKTWCPYVRIAMTNDMVVHSTDGGKIMRPALSPDNARARGAYNRNPSRDKGAPGPNGVAPKPPAWMGREGKDKWEEILADLDDRGAVSSDLRELLILYCTAHEGFIKQYKLCEQAADDGTAIFRHFKEMHRCRNVMIKLLPEFGLTPASRGRLASFQQAHDENPMANLLGRLGVN